MAVVIDARGSVMFHVEPWSAAVTASLGPQRGRELPTRTACHGVFGVLRRAARLRHQRRSKIDPLC